ncbi:HEAT repeat domain-containing protein [Chamaesiphon sp. OTE_20_metabat_361]|uniref:HEAT repeat domain-containing protein n=1 Tax=Chamaesiphon sp. OTE_20_metabat_361 TaxID=2964689 RepID=UPI00286C057D|nr:HEAT repeat domain-containing protein [Chamaesiphon sp. OTE_20_metabat_361]
MIAELLLKLRERHPDFTDDLRFQYFYLNRLKWTESIVQILAELEDESHILRIVRLALEVDLLLGARLAGSVQTQFQEKTVGMIYALEISDRERVDLLGLTRSDAAIPGLMDAIERGCYQHYEHALNIQAVRVLGSFGTESTIPCLVKALQNRDFEVRESAAFSLEKVGGNVVITSLLEALNHECEYVRQEIIRTLGSMGATDAVPALISALENDSSDYRNVAAEAAKALGKLGAVDAVPALIHALDDEIYYEVYVNAIEALGEIGGETALAALRKTLEHGNQILRIEAEKTLAKLGDPIATSILIDALKSKNRDDLIEVLGEVNSNAAVFTIIDALENKNTSYRAAEVLGKLGNSIAIPALRKAVMNGDHYSRGKAVEALGNLGGESEISFLIDVLQTDENPSIRNSAVRAIANFIENEAISVISSLINALKDRSDCVRKSVIEILGELGDSVFIYELINALNDEHYSVRICAAKALIKSDNEIAIPALINSLANKDWWVGYYSIQALEKFSDRTVVRDALFRIITDLVPSKPEITPEAVKTLKIRSAHALGFYNYEIEKLNIQ